MINTEKNTLKCYKNSMASKKQLVNWMIDIT